MWNFQKEMYLLDSELYIMSPSKFDSFLNPFQLVLYSTIIKHIATVNQLTTVTNEDIFKAHPKGEGK